MNASPSATSTSSVSSSCGSLDVDVGVPAVPEDPEEPVDPHVEARGLHQRRVVRDRCRCAPPRRGVRSCDRTEPRAYSSRAGFAHRRDRTRPGTGPDLSTSAGGASCRARQAASRLGARVSERHGDRAPRRCAPPRDRSKRPPALPTCPAHVLTTPAGAPRSRLSKDPGWTPIGKRMRYCPRSRCPCCTRNWTQTSASAIVEMRRGGASAGAVRLGPERSCCSSSPSRGGMTLATKGGKQVSKATRQAAAEIHDVRRSAGRQARVAPPRALPLEIRGIHVTGPLASLPGKFDEYLRLTPAGSTRSSSTSGTRAGRQLRLSPASRSPGVAGAVRTYYDAAAVAAQGASPRHSPDRTHRRLPGPAAVGGPPRPRDPATPTARSGRRRRVSAGSTRTTVGRGATPSTSPRPPPAPGSTRSCSTTSAFPPTATSAARSTAARRRRPRPG